MMGRDEEHKNKNKIKSEAGNDEAKYRKPGEHETEDVTSSKK